MMEFLSFKEATVGSRYCFVGGSQRDRSPIVCRRR